MKTAFILIVSILLSLQLSSCQPAASSSVAVSSPTPFAVQATSRPSPEPTPEPTPGPTQIPTFDATVLCEKDGIKVTAVAYVISEYMGQGIRLSIESTRKDAVALNCKYAVIDGFMMPSFFSTTINPDEKVEATLLIPGRNLEAAGFEYIREISTVFMIYNADNFNVLCESDEVTFQTPFAHIAQSPTLVQGDELYNESGVRIVAIGRGDDIPQGAAQKYYVQNTTGADILVQTAELLVNGFDVNRSSSLRVNQGRHAIGLLSIYHADFAKYDIDLLKTLDFHFNVIDASSNNTLAVSPLIHLDYS